jgi:hypothetical protein
MSASGNRVKTMLNLIKEELGTQMKTPKNIEISKDGSIIQDPETIANVFNDYYASITQKILDDNPLSITNEINVNAVKYNRNSMFLTPTMEEEVVDLIKGLHNKKINGTR